MVRTTAQPLDIRVHLGLLFIQLTFGGFHVMGKYVLGTLHPFAVAGARVVVATPVLLGLAWLVDRTWPAWRDLPRLALLGLLGVFANQLLFIIGLQYTTATNAGILMPSIPVFAVGLAALFGQERLEGRRLAGIGLAVAGALVMLDVTRFSMGGSSELLGNGLILSNCLCYSAFLVLQKPLLGRLPPLTLIAWSFLFGGLPVLLVTAGRLPELNPVTLPTPVLAGMIYVVLVPTVINYALATWAVKRSSPALVAAYITLQPVAAGSLAMLFLGERAGLRELAGFVLIVLGLYTVNRRRAATRG
jgi:drug/metabolite transporter (DMT)-like permease